MGPSGPFNRPHMEVSQKSMHCVLLTVLMDVMCLFQHPYHRMPFDHRPPMVYGQPFRMPPHGQVSNLILAV